MEELKKVEAGQVPVVAELKIVLYQNGQIQFFTSNQDKILMLGLLEIGKELAKGLHKPNVIQVPAGAIPDSILKGNGQKQ